MRGKRKKQLPERRQAGAELVEFALVLPLLILLLAGIANLGTVFALRQKMTNATREGARIVVSSPLTNQSCQSATPCSIVAAANAVAQYMARAGVSLSCIQPGAPTAGNPLEWTYTCANGTSLVIDRGYTIAAPDGVQVGATRVTLTCPLHWWLTGFLPGLTQFTTMTAQSTMQNLVS